MAEQVFVDCQTGMSVVHDDSFLAVKPVPIPPTPNLFQQLAAALSGIPSSDPGYNVAQTVLKVLANNA